MDYKAVIFDLDGTLLDTLEDLADSVNIVLHKNGFPKHDLDKYKYFVGDGITNLLRRALSKEQANEATITRCVVSVREEYDKRWADKTRPYPQIPELLQELVNRNIRIAILTNKPDAPAQNVVKHFFPGIQFEIVSGAIPSQPLKPDPAGALAIANQMKLLPNEFLYLGDTDTDMKTAKAAGMYPIGVLWGFRTATELTQSGAELLLENPKQLFDHKNI